MQTTATRRPRLTSFELLIGGEKTALGVATIADVVAYLRPGHPDLSAVKRGYTTWRLYSAGKPIGSVHELGGVQ